MFRMASEEEKNETFGTTTEGLGDTIEGSTRPDSGPYTVPAGEKTTEKLPIVRHKPNLSLVIKTAKKLGKIASHK